MYLYQYLVHLPFLYAAIVEGLLVKETVIKGSHNGLSSSGFISPPATKDIIYTFKLHNTAIGDSASVIFYAVEYQIKQAILKVYDGYNTNAPSFVYTQNSTRPVFQSSGRNLYVVFKPGGDERFPGARDYNFKAAYKFTNSKRGKDFSELPATGYCHQVAGHQQGVMTFNGSSLEYPFLDCTWQLQPYQPADMISFSIIRASVSSLKQGDSLQVSQAHGTQSLISYPLGSGTYSSETFTWDSPVTIHLHMHIGPRDVLQLLFRTHNSSVPAKELTGRKCAFAMCEDRCMLPWQVCGESQGIKDASCSELPMRCEYPSYKCYSDADLCDGFPDCRAFKSVSADEKDCECKSFLPRYGYDAMKGLITGPQEEKTEWPHVFFYGSYSSQEQCQQQCASHTKCMAYTYFAPTSKRSQHHGQCYGRARESSIMLKSTSPEAATSFLSGERTCTEGGDKPKNWNGLKIVLTIGGFAVVCFLVVVCARGTCCKDLAQSLWHSGYAVCVSRGWCQDSRREEGDEGVVDDQTQERGPAGEQLADDLQGREVPASAPPLLTVTLPEPPEEMDQPRSTLPHLPARPTGTWSNTGDIQAPPPPYANYEQVSTPLMGQTTSPRRQQGPQGTRLQPPPSYNTVLLMGHTRPPTQNC